MKTLINKILNKICLDIKESVDEFKCSVWNFSQIESARLEEVKQDMFWYFNKNRQNYETWEYYLINDNKPCMKWISWFNKPKTKCPESLRLKYAYKEQ